MGSIKIKNKVVIISIILLFLLVIATIIVIFLDSKNKELVKINEIKNHYGEIVTVTKKTQVYHKNNDDYVSMGTVSNGMEWELDSTSINSSAQVYFKVKNEDFYLFYKDVKPVDKKAITEMPTYYLPFNKVVKTKEKTKFYVDQTVVFEVAKEYEFQVMYENEISYFASYLNRIFELRKDEVEETNLPDEVEEAKNINVFYIPKIDEACKTDSCITIKKTSELLQQMKDQETYTITDEEYISWLKGFIKLKKGASLITIEKESEELSAKLKELNYTVSSNQNFKFSNTNKTTDRNTKLEKIDRYSINQNITVEQFSKMLAGETIVIPKPIVPDGKTLPDISAKATKIAVVNYHFFYDPKNSESCNESICLDVARFREQLDYLKKNQYKTLTMEEYRAWMYGEIDLPARSVLLTIDDGAMGTGKHNGNKLIPILEEYKMHATLFLITGWWDISNYKSSYLDIESHTFDMHTEGLCKNQPRGAQMLCSSKDKVMADLKKSIDIIGSNKAFCFPFYATNTEAIANVKEAGFKLAFVGGSQKSTRSSNKYLIPRYPIYKTTTLNQFINMIT